MGKCIKCNKSAMVQIVEKGKTTCYCSKCYMEILKRHEEAEEVLLRG